MWVTFLIFASNIHLLHCWFTIRTCALLLLSSKELFQEYAFRCHSIWLIHSRTAKKSMFSGVACSVSHTSIIKMTTKTFSLWRIRNEYKNKHFFFVSGHKVVMSLNRNQIDCEHRSTFLLKRSQCLWENPKNAMNLILKFFFLCFAYLHLTCICAMHDERKFP